MKDKPFEDLQKSVREGGAILRGRRKPSRSEDLLPEPVEIRRLGGHKPRARILLRIVGRHPEAVLDVVRAETQTARQG
jgi:hypothetical protein